MTNYIPATTHEERLTMLQTALREIKTARPRGWLRVSEATARWVEELTPRLVDSNRDVFMLKLRWSTAVEELDEATGRLRSHVRHVWDLIRSCARGRADADEMYTAIGLPAEDRLLDGDECGDWLQRAQQILEGSEQLGLDCRLKNEQMLGAIADLRQVCATAAEALDEAKGRQGPYFTAQRLHNQLSHEAIALCQRMVAELRHELGGEDSQRARSIMRSYGLVFTSSQRPPKPSQTQRRRSNTGRSASGLTQKGFNLNP